jgi:hypothetical protein
LSTGKNSTNNRAPPACWLPAGEPTAWLHCKPQIKMKRFWTSAEPSVPPIQTGLCPWLNHSLARGVYFLGDWRGTPAFSHWARQKFSGASLEPSDESQMLVGAARRCFVSLNMAAEGARLKSKRLANYSGASGLFGMKLTDHSGKVLRLRAEWCSRVQRRCVVAICRGRVICRP